MFKTLFKTPSVITRRSLYLALALCAPFYSSSVYAQEPEKGAAVKALRTRRAAGPIKVDGRLDEPDWQNLDTATDFTQRWPDLGRPATLKTEAKVLYDNNYLYIGARMHHPLGNANVVRRVHRRDQDSSSDWFCVYVDTLHDRSTGFCFAVNAAGVQLDGIMYNDTGADSSWDGVWESAVSVDEDGWTAEFKIPLTLLKIRPGGGPQTWGINFQRADEGKIREDTRWQQAPRGQNGFVSLFPSLVGIDGLVPRLRREFIPYASTQRKFETMEQDFDDRKWTNRFGIDARFGITSSSQLDLSVYPDFGQVEVDESVINLGTTETFFEEKRPFFLEGADIFRVIGQTMFYSRRIGKGIYPPYPQSGETLLDAPRIADIGLAAKYTAKTQSGLNIGILGASVEPTRAELLDADGNKFDRETYPLTNFGVVRVKQFLGNRGNYIGGFASYMRQASDSGREAQTYALDGSFMSKGRSATIKGSLAMSDAGYRNSDSEDGWRGYLYATREWNNGLSIDLTAVNATKSYNPNDMGYLNRADEQRASFSVYKFMDHRWWILRNYNGYLDVSASKDQAGFTTSSDVYGQVFFNFTNFWVLQFRTGVQLSAYDDRELRTFNEPVKKYLKREDVPHVNVFAGTADNKPYSVSVSGYRYWLEGGPTSSYNLFHTIKPHSALEVKIGSGYRREEGTRSYVGTRQGTPITGLRRLSQFDQTLRISYAIDPHLSLQFFTQWLAGTWNYRDFKQYVDNDTLADCAAPAYTADSAREWIVNLIARWEFRPGSVAYLVYTRGAASDQLISHNGSMRPWRDLSAMKDMPSDDAIQLKVSWLFR